MRKTLSPFLTKLSVPDAEGMFSGFASTFGGQPDSYGDVVEPGAFAKSLADHKANGTRPAMLWSHSASDPIGTWVEITETQAGLEVVGQLTLEVAKAREAYALMKAGELALSIGFNVMTGGAETRAGVNYLKALELHEVSAVSLPANPNARITQVKGLLDTPQNFEHAVRDVLGLSARQAKRLCAGGWSALVREEPAAPLQDDSEALARKLRTITQSLRKSP